MRGLSSVVPPRTVVERGFPRGLPEAEELGPCPAPPVFPTKTFTWKTVSIFRTGLGIVDFFLVEGKVSCDSFQMIIDDLCQS